MVSHRCNFAAAGALFFARGTLSHLFNGVYSLRRWPCHVACHPSFKPYGLLTTHDCKWSYGSINWTTEINQNFLYLFLDNDQFQWVISPLSSFEINPHVWTWSSFWSKFPARVEFWLRSTVSTVSPKRRVFFKSNRPELLQKAGLMIPRTFKKGVFPLSWAYPKSNDGLQWKNLI